MSQLIVRQLDEDVVQALRSQAAKRGRSAEAEHREILRHALLGPRRSVSLKEALLNMPDVGHDRDFKRKKDRGRRVAL